MFCPGISECVLPGLLVKSLLNEELGGLAKFRLES